MRFAFTDEHKKAYPITVLCEVIQVSRQGYYNYQSHQNRPATRTEGEELRLREAVRRIDGECQGSYGSRRMSQQLQDEGDAVGRYTRRPFQTGGPHFLEAAPFPLDRLAAVKKFWTVFVTVHRVTRLSRLANVY